MSIAKKAALLAAEKEIKDYEDLRDACFLKIERSAAKILDPTKRAEWLLEIAEEVEWQAAFIEADEADDSDDED